MKHILLQWNSKNHGLIVALRSVLTLFEEKHIKATEIRLLQSSDFNDLELSELNIYKNNSQRSYDKIIANGKDEKEKKRVTAVYEITKDMHTQGISPAISQKRLHIKSVTHYQSIYNALRDYLRTLPDTLQLHINVSPGTPQMHTVWLMLNSSGYLPASVKIWSSQYDKENNTYLFDEIKFKPKTYLNEVLEKTYQTTSGIKINPNDTKSENRKAAEEQLELFSSIPETPILLIGERGTGKTTYVEQFIRARYINSFFQTLPCGIFSEELMRSELFGYKAGAFTGATKDKSGIFDKFKDGGLLFLDEIQDLSISLQRQLMQVLQSKKYMAIGGEEEKETNFRLVTATNLPFEQLCEKLSPDFLDRIAQFIVEVPPLRACNLDIFLDWQKTWNNIAGGAALPESEILEQFLTNYTFPGNFRDLQRLANHIFAFSQKHPMKKAINLSIECIKKWQSKSKNQTEESYFLLDKNYDMLINNFNKNLAEWAISTYGNRKNACDKLAKSAGWLSNALQGKSRKL